jgi:hypothetical protein
MALKQDGKRWIVTNDATGVEEFKGPKFDAEYVDNRTNPGAREFCSLRQSIADNLREFGYGITNDDIDPSFRRVLRGEPDAAVVFDRLIASMIADDSNKKPAIQTIIAAARTHEKRTRI